MTISKYKCIIVFKAICVVVIVFNSAYACSASHSRIWSMWCEGSGGLVSDDQPNFSAIGALPDSLSSFRIIARTKEKKSLCCGVPL